MRFFMCVAASLMCSSGAALALDDTPTQTAYVSRADEAHATPLRHEADARAAKAKGEAETRPDGDHLQAAVRQPLHAVAPRHLPLAEDCPPQCQQTGLTGGRPTRLGTPVVLLLK